MELQTPRLLLRPWEESDAEALYELAKDPDVGPAAGWNVHKDVEESREIIRTILSAPGTFAIFGRRDGQLRGSCGFFPTRAQGAEAGELEIGYWVGKPFWGRGIAPEAPALYDAFVVTLGDEARLEGVKLVRELRDAGLKADLDHAARSMKAQFKYANKLGVKKVIVLAGDELAKGVVKLRDMANSTEEEIARGEIVARLTK